MLYIQYIMYVQISMEKKTKDNIKTSKKEIEALTLWLSNSVTYYPERTSSPVKAPLEHFVPINISSSFCACLSMKENDRDHFMPV